MGHDGPVKARLLAGESLGGHFWPAEGGEAAHGVLSFTAEDGCRVELIERGVRWPHKLGGPWFALHGETLDGVELSFLDAWVGQISAGEQVLRLHASTLAIGALTNTQERWTRAICSTANLSEWQPENGLTFSGHTAARPQIARSCC